MGLDRDDSADIRLSMQAVFVYNAGMKSMQYTIRGIPPDVDACLRKRAKAEGKSLNALVVELLEREAIPPGPPYHDLDWLIGTGTPEDQKAQEEAQAWLDSLPNGLLDDIDDDLQ